MNLFSHVYGMVLKRLVLLTIVTKIVIASQCQDFLQSTRLNSGKTLQAIQPKTFVRNGVEHPTSMLHMCLEKNVRQELRLAQVRQQE